MQRYKFTIQYDGAKFPDGWQIQPNSVKSVQRTLKDAAYKLLGEEVDFYGSGRTDGGVHALAQVAHVDLQKRHSLKSLHEGMNHFLGNSGCRISAVAPVSPEFHARFSIVSKQYEYRISHSRICDIFDQDRVWWIRETTAIDWELVQKEALNLLGTHDFSSFRSAHCQSGTPIRTIESIQFRFEGQKIFIKFQGKSFLHKQIRIMVGTLVDIGRGKLSDVCSILQARDRCKSGQTAPPSGLFLLGPRYG